MDTRQSTRKDTTSSRRTGELPAWAALVELVPLRDWPSYPELKAFLHSRPKSTLLAIVEHLWPGFLSLPSEHRARTWFWLKTELDSLTESGELVSTIGEDGVATWSIHSSDHPAS
jgi:hypothetical protein